MGLALIVLRAMAAVLTVLLTAIRLYNESQKAMGEGR